MTRCVDSGTSPSPADAQNGLANHWREPPRIRDVHELEKNFISEWVAQFHEQKKNHRNGTRQ